MQEVQVCVASVGVLGDVARAIEEALCPYLDPILHILLGNLKNSEVQRQIKPNILAVFGDIALAVGDRFEPYVPAVLEARPTFPFGGLLVVEHACLVLYHQQH